MQSACYVLYCHLWSVRLYHIFLRYLLNGWIVGGKNIEHRNMFWFFLQILTEKYPTLRRIKRYIITNVLLRSSCKVPAIRVRFNDTWIFWTELREILKYHMLISVQWESSCSMQADRQTDMAKLIVTFRNFTNESKSDTLDVIEPLIVWTLWPTLQRCPLSLKLYKKLKVSLCTPWRHTGALEVQLHSFLAAALDRGEWPTFSSRPLYTQWRAPGTRCWRQGGPCSRSVCFGEEKFFLPFQD
jgi:hypothetical protein